MSSGSILAKPRVSVCLPVYNGSSLIARALDSLLSQTYVDFELLISDNASTDSTPEVCQDYQQKDSRISYFRQQTNIGPFNNFQFLLNRARCEYMMWAPHDDEWDPNFIASGVEALDQCPEASSVFGKVEYLDKSGRLFMLDAPPYGLDGLQFDRIKRYITTNITDNLLYGLHRTRVVQGIPFDLQDPRAEKTFIFELIISGKVLDAPQMSYRNYYSYKSQQDLENFFNLKVNRFSVISLCLKQIKRLFKVVPPVQALALSVLIMKYRMPVLHRLLSGRISEHRYRTLFQ